MKAILITEADRKQIVLTPETEFEEKIFKMFGEGSKDAKIYLGGYYRCQGGWTRQGEKDSLLVVFDEQEIQPKG